MSSNLEDWLRARNKPFNGTFACPIPGCRYKGPASTFADVTDRRNQFNGNAFVCSADLFAKDAALKEIAFLADLLIISKMPKEQQAQVSALVDWWSPDSEEANYIRAQRRMLFEKWGWTLLPGQGDVLSSACRKSFQKFFDKLNDLAVDYAKPADVKWPAVPPLEYVQPK